MAVEADCRHDAEREVEGIIQAGGNIWDGPCGNLIVEDDWDEGYEMLFTIETERWPTTVALLSDA